MRLGLFLAVAGLLLVLYWLARSPERSASPRPAALPADGRALTEAELPEPENLGESPAPSPSAARSAPAQRAKPAQPTSSAKAARAPIHGRLVVRETGDAIEGSFSVRLRTIDLLRSEDLRTSSDGSFRGTTLFPRSVVLALVKEESGRELVDHEALFEPGSEDAWLVPVPESSWPTFARGQVVNRRGDPLEEGRVRLVPLVAGLQASEAQVEPDGTFHLQPLRPGPHRLFVQGRSTRAAPAEVTLRSGPNELGLLVVDEPDPAGDLVLRISAPDGIRPSARFELRAEEGGLAQRFDTSLGTLDEGGRLWLTVPGLPAGRYTLAIHSLDGLVYAPASLTLTPPARLEIHATGTARPGTVFRARDGGTGELLLGFGVFGRFEGTWELASAWRREDVAPGRRRNVPAEEVRLRPGFESWVVSASGYQAVFGTFAGAGETIWVDLEPGWSELFQFEDAGGDAFALPGFERFLVPPFLSGVEVLVDGRSVGASDAHGFFALSGAVEPEAIAFRKAGWIPVKEYALDILRTVELVQSR